MDGTWRGIGGSSGAGDIVDRALETVRRHLGMDVADLPEFVDGKPVFRAVPAPGPEALIGALIKPGNVWPLDATDCRHILAGRLPRLIRDTADEPVALSLAITHTGPIRSQVRYVADARC